MLSKKVHQQRAKRSENMYFLYYFARWATILRARHFSFFLPFFLILFFIFTCLQAFVRTQGNTPERCSFECQNLLLFPCCTVPLQSESFAGNGGDLRVWAWYLFTLAYVAFSPVQSLQSRSQRNTPARLFFACQNFLSFPRCTVPLQSG